MSDFLSHAKDQTQRAKRASSPKRKTLEEIQERYPWAEGPVKFANKRQLVRIRCRGCGEILKDEDGNDVFRATSDMIFDRRCPDCEKEKVQIDGNELPYRKAARLAARANGYNALRPGTVDDEEVEEIEIAVCGAVKEEYREMHLDHLRSLAQANAEGSYRKGLEAYLAEQGEDAEE
jgi:hypothetical protein